MKHPLLTIATLAALIAAGSLGAPAIIAEDKPHAHDHAHGDQHTGAKHELGVQKSGTIAVDAVQIGDVVAGKEAIFEIDVEGGKPGALRAWIGAEDGKGSTKAKGLADAEGDGFDVHIEVPATLAPAAKLWVEVEVAGARSTVSFALATGK